MKELEGTLTRTESAYPKNHACPLFIFPTTDFLPYNRGVQSAAYGPQAAQGGYECVSTQNLTFT